VNGHDHGKADISIDGVFDQTVDCYTPGWITDVVYSKSGLTSGTHTLQITVRGDMNASADGHFIEIDALEPTTTFNVIDDASTGMQYSSNWAIANSGAYFNGSDHYTTTGGSTLSYTFTGKSITWYGVIGQDHGKADVSIDGVFDQTIDCFASAWQVTQVYTKSGLTGGTHTLTITVRSDKNSAATNSYIEVDALGYTS
jgi:hypothetical protein